MPGFCDLFKVLITLVYQHKLYTIFANPSNKITLLWDLIYKTELIIMQLNMHFVSLHLSVIEEVLSL